MRVLIWHGYLLEGSGSNVAAAKVTEALRRAGHDVLLLCQAAIESAPPFIDQVGTVGQDGVSPLAANGRASRETGRGRAVLLRPDIGRLLAVFVVDVYEGFVVKRFVDLSHQELDGYLARNVAALRAAASWYRPDVVISSHVVPGAAVAARAELDAPYVAFVHGSDLVYAVRLQDRYADLAREGLEGAASVTGGSRDVVDRALAYAPSATPRAREVPLGVDVERFRPRPGARALLEAAAMLEHDPGATRGRPPDMDRRLAAMMGRDPEGPQRLAGQYDQGAPDRDAAERLRRLARGEGPLVAYLGKLIPAKGVELFIQALAAQPADVRGLIVGYGGHREWLEALVSAIDDGGEDLEWIRTHSGLQIELLPDEVKGIPSLASRVTFTGLLDHRYVPRVLAAVDVLVVPSIVPEAFAMVAAEGAAAGCLPLVARHSGLAEVAATVEDQVGKPGLFSYEPGPGASGRVADGIRSLLSIPGPERQELRRQVSEFARRTWTWDRTAALLVTVDGAATYDSTL